MNPVSRLGSPISPRPPTTEQVSFPRKARLLRLPSLLVALSIAMEFLYRHRDRYRLAGLGAAWAPADGSDNLFGFQKDGADPALATVAKSSTDQTFWSLGVLRLKAVVRSETLDETVTRRLDKARELGARYALSGDIRREDTVVILSVRIEDVSKCARSGSLAWRLRGLMPRFFLGARRKPLVPRFVVWFEAAVS